MSCWSDLNYVSRSLLFVPYDMLVFLLLIPTLPCCSGNPGGTTGVIDRDALTAVIATLSAAVFPPLPPSLHDKYVIECMQQRRAAAKVSSAFSCLVQLYSISCELYYVLARRYGWTFSVGQTLDCFNLFHCKLLRCIVWILVIDVFIPRRLCHRCQRSHCFPSHSLTSLHDPQSTQHYPAFVWAGPSSAHYPLYWITWCVAGCLYCDMSLFSLQHRDCLSHS